LAVRAGGIGAHLSRKKETSMKMHAFLPAAKRAQLGINTTGFSWTIPSLERVATNQPRTVGAEIKYSF
jgi:hypothetical protein